MKYLTIIPIIISLTSCSTMMHEPMTYRIITKTVNCPENYLYNTRDGLCYYSNNSLAPYREAKTDGSVGIQRVHTKRHKKAQKQESINCVKALAYCGVSNGTN